MRRIIANTLKKRDVLYSDKTPRELLLELARAYRDAGLPGDAVQHYAQAADAKGLDELKAWALAEGDTFMLCSVARVDNSRVTQADWQAVASRARELGKITFAERAESILQGGEFMGRIKSAQDEEEDK